MSEADKRKVSVQYICNETMKVGWDIHDRWLLWMRNSRIPALMHSGCFLRYRLSRLQEMDDTEGPTYTLQLELAYKTDFERYRDQFLQNFNTEAFTLWGDAFIGFRTLMQVVE